MNILALDLGLKRIGLAISNEDIIGQSSVIEGEDRHIAIQKILDIARKENIKKIIIGIPKNKDKRGEDIARSFALELNKSVEIPIEFVDETLTSKEAQRFLSKTKLDSKSKKYKEEVDRISAKLILEQYLNKND